MKRRITITIYDDETFEFFQSRPLEEMINSTKETGHCLMLYSNNVQVNVEKTKAGYKMSAYNRNSRD